MTVEKRAINQENWKRTQVRLPPETHDKLIWYARENNVSLNSAIINLLELGLKDQPRVDSQEEIKATLMAFFENYIANQKKKDQ